MTPHLSTLRHCAQLLVATFLLALGGCQRGSVSNTECPLPGDLVITEVFANPAGADEGAEWFEVYNARNAPLGLAGLRLRTSRLDGSAEKRHSLAPEFIDPNGYMVFGSADPQMLPAHMDYGYGTDLGTMTNTGGKIAITCGSLVIDEITYENAPEAASLALDGAMVPDSIANDDPANWCEAQSEYEAGASGTPGAANPPCDGAGLCMEGGVPREVRAPAAGDLVITEVMPNPSAVADPDGEWFELLVEADVDLNGLQIGADLADPDTVLSAPDCVSVAAGTRLLFAREADTSLNGGLPAVDHLFTFGLTNSGGTLQVGLGGVALDAVSWTSSSAGAALSLDPTAEDPTANDDPANWCDATTPYGDGDLGTPADANPSCGGGGEGTCLDGGNARAVVPPAPGDLVITELMPNPDAVADADGEWFEVLVKADVDLNGLALGADLANPGTTLTSAECLAVTQGTRLLFARDADGAVNGGLPPVDHTFSFGLTNSNGNLQLGVGMTLLDAVSWTSSTAGAALSLDPAAEDPTANDDPTNWCDATAPYGDGDLGTPAAVNPSCGGGGGGMCVENGNPRPIVSPKVGDLVLTEILPDPSAVSDANGEFFELLVKANVDLNGLQLGADIAMPQATVDSADCLSVSAGDRVLFARNPDGMTNGGLPAVDQTFTFSLVNSNGALQIGLGGNLLDGITWTSSTAGAALSLDPGAEDPVANDDPTNWCDAATPYGDGDLGSPGAANPPCPGGDTCLDGGNLRAIVNPVAGDLVITELMPNPNAVSDANGEYFEVLATADVDLNGLQLGADINMPSNTLASGSCLAVTQGTRLLFARNPDGMTNGGLPAVDHTFTFSLLNGNGTLQLGLAGALLDEVTWTSSSAGAALNLTPAAEDTVSNDDPQNWCDATTPYGDGDLGSPAASNEVCP